MKVALDTLAPVDEKKISPDYVRISAASAMALRMQSGRFSRDFDFGGINILLNYDNGCLSDCSYCGLARTRPGSYEDKSFIRVEWPLVSMDELVDRMAEHEDKLTRLCISMVTHGSAYKDTVELTRKIVAKVKTPLSLLIAPPVLNREKLQVFKDLGVDMIGVGLDAITEETFIKHRTDVPNGSLKWDNYWDIIHASRDIFGPGKVNIHTVVGLGESDKEMIDMFYYLDERQILPYMFSFNPEAESRLANWPKASQTKWRRIQLVKHLIENYGLQADSLSYDAEGKLTGIQADDIKVNEVLNSLDGGVPFMTDGCPIEGGSEAGCTRPYGSYRPSEPFRDFPFQPEADDMGLIREELALDEIWNK
ncbi:MAG: radical SAM protein [Cyclobacteriaceae bacterium]|nr:radical SAM protein [Cyclobacteriaceae bacterium]